jgi:hypothetical protein
MERYLLLVGQKKHVGRQLYYIIHTHTQGESESIYLRPGHQVVRTTFMRAARPRRPMVS